MIDKVSCFSDLNYLRIHSHLFLQTKRLEFVSRRNIIEYFQNFPVGTADGNIILKVLLKNSDQNSYQNSGKKKIVHSGNNS